METITIPRQLLVRIVGRLEPSSMIQTVYKTPSQVLREQADSIEQQERDLYEIREYLNGTKP